MIKEIRQQATERMAKSLESLGHDLAKIRTGRAHPDILAHVTVDYYGTPTPIAQIANIIVLDARTLSITPWEKGLSAKVEKAILMSDLGLNPTNLGDSLRIPMPDLNEERRKEMAKRVRSEAEKARIAIRSIRRDANSEVKELLKQKEISEDDAKKAEVETQNLTNDMIARVDTMTEGKEKDLMAI